MTNEAQKIEQTLLIKDRRTVTIDGVLHIVSFDEGMLVIDSEGGRIVVEGDGLKVEALDKQNAKISLVGKINGVFYSDERLLKRGFGKIFK